MAVGAGAVDDPVVVRRRRVMPCRPVRMAVIAAVPARIGRRHIVPDITLPIPKREPAGVATVIVTGPAVDGRSGGHPVIRGPDSFAEMAGQGTTHRAGMTEDTGTIRGRLNRTVIMN